MKKVITTLLLLVMGTAGLMAQNFFERHEYSIEIVPLINTPESEIAPTFMDGELVYTALRAQPETNSNSRTGEQLFYNVFSTQIDVAGFPQTLGKQVNGFGNAFHEGPVAWCETTGELFVTQSNIPTDDRSQRRRLGNDVNLKLVVKKQVDSEWVVVEDLPFNNPEYDFAHPAVSPSGDTLVFSSTRKTGYGKSDLYMSVRTDGQWSEPQNLGERVNTAGNEMFPGYGPGGLLIFSSDGHTKNTGQLDLYCINLSGSDSVMHLGDGINTEHDDFGMVVHPSGEFGYFSSNRPGAGSDDIYRIQFNPLYEYIGGMVADTKGNPVEGVTVDLQKCSGETLQSATSGSNGRFAFEVRKDSCYQAMASKDGYDSDLKRFYLEKFVRLNIVQETRYRVQAIDAESNEPIEGVSIECDDRQWVTNKEGFAKINADSAAVCDLKVTGGQYFNYDIGISNYQFNPGDDVVETAILYKKEKNKVFSLKNIRFFLDKWRLLPESERELEKLVKLMNDNPSLKVEISTHTDSRGESKYNLWLSQKRSDSATDYLVENGIAKERIVSRGYGESRLINHCADGVNCSEEEHLENRRTEFVILDF